MRRLWAAGIMLLWGGVGCLSFDPDLDYLRCDDDTSCQGGRVCRPLFDGSNARYCVPLSVLPDIPSLPDIIIVNTDLHDIPLLDVLPPEDISLDAEPDILDRGNVDLPLCEVSQPLIYSLDEPSSWRSEPTVLGNSIYWIETSILLGRPLGSGEAQPVALQSSSGPLLCDRIESLTSGYGFLSFVCHKGEGQRRCVQVCYQTSGPTTLKCDEAYGCDTLHPQAHPAIGSIILPQGDVVLYWSQYRSSSWSIVSSPQFAVSDYSNLVSSSSKDQQNPVASGPLVAWEEDNRVKLFHEGQTLVLPPNGGEGRHPALSEEILAMEVTEDGRSRIALFVLDGLIERGEDEALLLPSAQGSSCFEPTVWGNTVAWREYRTLFHDDVVVLVGAPWNNEPQAMTVEPRQRREPLLHESGLVWRENLTIDNAVIEGVVWSSCP